MSLLTRISGRMRGNLSGRDKAKPLSRTPSIEHNRFLFLGGLHRSGTTILLRLLSEHEGASGFRKTGSPADEGQHLQSVFPPAREYGGPGRFAFDPAAYLDESSDLVSEENRNRLLREWGAYYDLGKKVLLEKSPPNIVRARFLQALFPGARFVFIVRHPAAVALATQRMVKQSRVVTLMLHWYVAHSILLEDVPALRDALIVRYEDFAVMPQYCLDRILELAGLERYSPREEFVDHNEKYLTKWQSDCASENGALERLFPEALRFYERFGYGLCEPFVRDADIGRIDCAGR